MTERKVISGGNWHDPMVWEGGETPKLSEKALLEVEEDITVTIDKDIEVDSICSFEHLVWQTGAIKVANGFFNKAVLFTAVGIE